MDIVFMGTPDFAVPCLDALIKNYGVAAVVTQPDRPRGRGKQTVFPPVKELALKNNIPVYQPEKAKAPEFIERLKNINPDVIVVVAYGQILPESILNIPRLGPINVHASLLPKLRGAAPIQRSIINGDEKTGVTTMYISKGLDSGDMILKKEIDILPEDTYGSLHDKMSLKGAELLLETLKLIKDGNAPATPQDHDEATYAPMITRETEKINWNESAKNIVNLIRGLNPSPGAFTSYGENVLKIWEASVSGFNGHGFANGEIVFKGKNHFTVKTGEGFLDVLKLQQKGGKQMDSGSYMRGRSIEKGGILN